MGKKRGDESDCIDPTSSNTFRRIPHLDTTTYREKFVDNKYTLVLAGGSCRVRFAVAVRAELVPFEHEVEIV